MDIKEKIKIAERFEKGEILDENGNLDKELMVYTIELLQEQIMDTHSLIKDLGYGIPTSTFVLFRSINTPAAFIADIVKGFKKIKENKNAEN